LSRTTAWARSPAHHLPGRERSRGAEVALFLVAGECSWSGATGRERCTVRSVDLLVSARVATARQDASYAAQLLNEVSEGDETPLDSKLSIQRRSFYIERFSLDLWESLVGDAPVNVFVGEDYLDLNWDDEDDDDLEEEDDEENRDQAMELDSGLIFELAGWLRSVRFEEVYDARDDYGFVKGDFEDFRTFILAVAERGEGALFHFA
ncbi:hypothetical protein, partial [Nonomuraea insulae]